MMADRLDYITPAAAAAAGRCITNRPEISFKIPAYILSCGVHQANLPVHTVALIQKAYWQVNDGYNYKLNALSDQDVKHLLLK